MDSHRFSEPELVTVVVAPEEESFATERPVTPLTWRVGVWRRGVDDHPIGCLEVNQHNLPPRTNKAGKVLWKLPTDPAQVPKFGVLEQRRLWELYKEQKKLRRKQSKTDGGAGCGGGGGSTVGSFDEPHDLDGPTVERAAAAFPSSMADNEATSAAAVETERRPPMSPATLATKSPPKQSPLPSPPPGFTSAVANLSVQEPHNSQSTIPLQPPLPPPGLTASPGLPLGTLPSPTGESTKQVAEPPSVPPTLAPQPPPLLPCGYFTLSPVDRIAFPGSLASRVATTFRLLVATQPNGGVSQIAEWLAHYDPAAPSTLVMGTAQAVATSHADKLRQWYSLTTAATAATTPHPSPDGQPPHPATRWDCQGWTAQVLPSDSAVTAPGLVLVVLTGRTWQQHLLSFQLTLVLREERAMADTPVPVPVPVVPPGSYRICNEILCLSLLNGA